MIIIENGTDKSSRDVVKEQIKVAHDQFVESTHEITKKCIRGDCYCKICGWK